MTRRPGLRRHLKRLAADRRGVAVVEFALILPLLVTLYFGTVEASRLYTADRKVSLVSATISDLVSRAKTTISKSQAIDKYFAAAENIMTPYDDATLTQSVSLLQIDSEGVARVQWNVPFAGGVSRDKDSVYPLAADAEINKLARKGGGYLVVSEVTYSYVPLIGLIFPAPITLRHVEYFLPRFDGGIALAS